jgi:hypothetical protein
MPAFLSIDLLQQCMCPEAADRIDGTRVWTGDRWGVEVSLAWEFLCFMCVNTFFHFTARSLKC